MNKSVKVGNFWVIATLETLWLCDNEACEGPSILSVQKKMLEGPKIHFYLDPSRFSVLTAEQAQFFSDALAAASVIAKNFDELHRQSVESDRND